MKFRFLVSGPALSEAQVEALRHSIEDLAQSYGMDKFALPFLVESFPPGQTIRLVADPDFGAAMEMRACTKCGASWPTRTFAGDWCPICEHKSARWGLNAFRDWVRREPLDVVVFGLLMFVCGFAACKLLKP